MLKNILSVVLLLVAGRSIGADLFSSITALESARMNITEQAGLIADVNVVLLKSKQASFEIQLPSGTQVTAVFERLRENHQKGYSWQGHINYDTSQIINLSVFEDAIAGSLHTESAVYEIQPLGNYQIKMVKLKTEAFPECDGGQAVISPMFNELPQDGSNIPRAMETVDVIVVYTPQARQGAGGEAAIKATAQAAVDAMNSSLINSQVNTEIVLLYAGEADYNDSGSSSTDLNWIRFSSQVKDLLDLYGADMAGLLVNSLSGSCGRGYVMRNPGPGFKDSAVQVTARNCAVGNLSFAHEFGHNMGLEHNPEDSGATSTSASYPWSFGHYNSGLYRTVMSYSAPCTGGCTRRQYFSNPNVSYLGLATGIDNERDNARTLGLTSSVTSAFRTRVVDLIFADGFE